MDKEQKRRMATRTVVELDEAQAAFEYTIQVSGDCVELHQTGPEPWENEQGSGPDVSLEVWTMSKDVLKSLIKAAQWCIENSEAFEASHQNGE